MGHRRVVATVAVLTLLAACSDSSPDPTLATGTTTPPTTTTTTTTSTTTTTTGAPTTTTEGADARFAEIEALVQENYVGRFDAIYRKDAEALLQFVGSQSAFDDSLLAMEVSEFVAAPSNETLSVFLVDILLDRPDCLVVSLDIDASLMLGIPYEPNPDVTIFWPDESGVPLLAEIWQGNTPEQVWIEDCDLAIRGVTP